ncbi:MAG TPA: ATP-binding protein [Stellaceae bacterium]|nr:ATP-binding protein [Stellaceae bacterium]
MTVTRSEIESEIFDAQLHLLYEQVPIVLITNVVNAGLIALVLAAYVGETRWWLFFALIGALTAARVILWRRYRAAAPRAASSRGWARLATAGSALSGLIWGIAAGLFLPDDIVEQTFLAFVIGGMCAGALVSLSYHLPAFIAYVWPATLPLALRFLLDGSAIYVAMAAMVVLFSAALTVAAYNFRRSFVRGVGLQLELRQRSNELIAANERLHSEMAEHRHTEGRLHQAQKMETMGQLTGGIAHDFNNLLTSVIGNLELAQLRVGGDAQLATLLESAQMAAQRGATLTQRLLAFARRQHLEPRPVDVPLVVNGVEKLLQQTIGPAIRLVIEADPRLWPARIDPNQLELAILNLAVNARDAMPEGGTLSIRSEGRRSAPDGLLELAPGDYVVVSVSDTGTGMDAQTLARAFEPFFTTKEVGRGSGLGLPMVQGFAAQSGGAVHLESAPGRGTKAELWLPRAAVTRVERDAAKPAARRPNAPAKILVCDDDRGVLEFVGTALRDSGHTVWEAYRPSDALRILEREQPIDLLLVDYAMPEMNGAAVMERARHHQPGLKLLLMTGDAEALQSGGVAGVPLLSKPFKIAQLTDRVAQSLVGPCA